MVTITNYQILNKEKQNIGKSIAILWHDRIYLSTKVERLSRGLVDAKATHARVADLFLYKRKSLDLLELESDRLSY